MSTATNDGIAYCKGAREENAKKLFNRKINPKKCSISPKSSFRRGGIKERMDQLSAAMNKDNFVECRDEALKKSDPNYGILIDFFL